MSLVNDALKRAKEAQKKGQPEAPVPQFRPPEPAAAPSRGIGMLVPVVIAGIAIVGLSVVWQNRHKAAAREPAVPPKPIAPVVVVQETKPPVQQVAAPTPKPAAPVVAVTEKPEPTPAAVSAPAPQLKLQAIFYTPGHSSAMINGKSVKTGDVYKGFRVTAITQKSATLVSATQTNVMTLNQD
jgi:hypothetical protein